MITNVTLMQIKERIQHLTDILNKAANAYYNTDNELMSNFEYDKLYDELVLLEQQSGIILPNSPTQRAGIKINKDVTKITHEFPALSLAKTKDITIFPTVFKTRDELAVLMWKEDGGTLIATYDNGRLTTLATRGDGFVGEDITHNAPFIHGLPTQIPIKSHFVVRGECLMSYDEFNRINSELPENATPYENPRNLANATVSLAAEKKNGT